MIAQIEPASLAPYLAGPSAAVIVLVLVLWGLYTLVVKHFMPLASKLGDRHLAQIDAMIANQRDESKAVSKALSAIEKSLGAVDRRLARLEGSTDVSGLITPNPGAMSPDRG